MEEKRIPSFDGSRAISILWVISTHLFVRKTSCSATLRISSSPPKA
jgi:peptidoglycan/LPS O-acetylase OafA/YrhL